jgi:aspartate oxidase
VGGLSVYADAGRNPHWPGNAAIKAYRLRGKDGWLLEGTGLFALLGAQIRTRGIAVHWKRPALRLLTDSAGEVVGAAAAGPDGPLTVCVRRAVVLACGGRLRGEPRAW